MAFESRNRIYAGRVLAVCVLLSAGAWTLFRRHSPHMTEKTISVAFPAASSASSYDPLRIHLGHEYVFLANIYSPLVEYAPDGQLVSAVAERFEWIGNEARFTFRKDLRTVDGHPIDAYDAETMFKRVLVLGGNTHGDLTSMLCGGRKLKSMDDPCPEMQVHDNGQILSIRFAKQTPFFFPMLTAIDFAVIPRNSLDPQSLAIRDFRNTSGPYYVKNDSVTGNIELAANIKHFHYSPNMPQRVILQPATLDTKKTSLQMLSEGTVDVVTEVDIAPQEDKIAYASTHPDVTLHTTLPICFYGAVFTQRGMKRLSLSQRISIGAILKKVFLAQYASRPGFESADQIFPFSGEGALTPAQLKGVAAEWASADVEHAITAPLSIWSMVKNFDGDDPALKRSLPNATVEYVRKIPGLVDYQKEKLSEPDAYITRTDMSFLEDIGLLSYHSHTDFFSLRGKDAAQWMHRYMNIAEKRDRIPMLRELHLQTLRDVYVVPIAFSPYALVLRKPWVSHMSQIFAGDTLWRLQIP